MNNLSTTLPYGRLEVRRLLPRILMFSLAVSIAIHLLVAVAYYVRLAFQEPETGALVRVRIVRYSELAPPPSIADRALPPVVGVSLAAARPTIGIPVPVPDFEIDPERTIASQKELSVANGPFSDEGTGTGGEAGYGGSTGDEIQTTPEIIIEDEEPDINAFIPVEKAPQVAKAVKPIYPDIARLSGLEGVVWVKVLVDKTGIPRKAVVINENANGILNQAAIDAAMQYRFTPAAMSTGPVQVWAALKFGFRLRESQ